MRDGDLIKSTNGALTTVKPALSAADFLGKVVWRYVGVGAPEGVA